ncbi:MAG: CIA30 family protein [Candidatus Omnitrophica bacterium]|nr:CIA30 family protein [Candidatus Omnitrophota bacterium]
MKCITTVLIVSIVLISVSYAAFDGDSTDSDAIVNYIKGNINTYYIDLSSLSGSSKQHEVIMLRKELERLVLRIDAGDIKNETLRKKIIALRRAALKNRNRQEFIIANFDRKGKNRLGGTMGANFAGDCYHISPWLDYTFENMEKRVGKKILSLTYDIAEGEVEFYNNVTIHYPFKKHNALSFKIRSDSSTIMVRLHDEQNAHFEYLVYGLTKQWQKVTVPFKKLSNYESLKTTSIKSISLVLNGEITDQPSGRFHLDDLVLTTITHDRQTSTPKGVIAYTVEGAVPLGTNKSLSRSSQ